MMKIQEVNEILRRFTNYLILLSPSFFAVWQCIKQFKRGCTSIENALNNGNYIK